MNDGVDLRLIGCVANALNVLGCPVIGHPSGRTGNAVMENRTESGLKVAGTPVLSFTGERSALGLTNADELNPSGSTAGDAKPHVATELEAAGGENPGGDVGGMNVPVAKTLLMQGDFNGHSPVSRGNDGNGLGLGGGLDGEGVLGHGGKCLVLRDRTLWSFPGNAREKYEEIFFSFSTQPMGKPINKRTKPPVGIVKN